MVAYIIGNSRTATEHLGFFARLDSLGTGQRGRQRDRLRR